MMDLVRRALALRPGDARTLLQHLFRTPPGLDFVVRLWNGDEISWGDRRDFTIAFRDPEAFRRCVATADPAQFAEAYIDGRLAIEGDLWAAVGLASHLRHVEVPLVDRLRLVPRLAVPASSHTKRRDRRDVQAHYDLSNEFFRLFLDERMVYSCAYFAHPEQRLEEAQERKLDLVCRKLSLRPGESLLDIGCGWGGLVIWAAQHYGVRAHGITLSEQQADEARRRVAAAGLADRVTIELRHYADLAREQFDKISSIGMVEHVGARNLPAYLRTVHRALKPGGLFLNHGITAPRIGPQRTGGAFIFRHVFPGAELLDIAQIEAEMEAAGFEIEDVHALRPHYALTLREWFRRFCAHRGEAARFVPERVLRIWDLYLAGCAYAFEDGIIGVHQVLAGKLDASGRTAAAFTRETV